MEVASVETPVGDVPQADVLLRTRVAAARRAIASNRTLLAVGIAIAAAALGAMYIAMPASSEKTDDAYVGADATTVAPKVRGLVSAVLVRDNQIVHAGDPLIQIDAEEFDARLANAQAELADADAGVAAAAAALVSLDAEERLAAADIGVAQSSIRSADAQASRAEADRERYESLLASGAVAARDVDGYRASAVSAIQEAARTRAILERSRDAARVTAAKRATLQAILEKARASAARARAALDLARQDQRHTLVSAPIDGVIGNRQVQQGDYVQPGSRLLTLIPLQGLYVTANFKETQTARMRPGETATIRIDALPGKTFSGVVDSIAPGSGSEFSLLPFEPGTGNFTKIVQRLPVRIRFDSPPSPLDGVRPGLSVTARVTLNH